MIILDANALIKLVLKEEFSEMAREKVNEAIESGEMVASPEIAFSEALNAVWKHVVFSKDIPKWEVTEHMVNLLFIWDKIIKLETVPLAQKAMEIAIENRMNFYDSLYVAASKLNNAPLLTFDNGIVRKAAKLGIDVL
jgi:predicted nucleic acid-binding protein